MAETPAAAPSQPASAPATTPAAPAPVVQPNATTGTPAAAERGTTAPSVPSSVELQDAYHEMDELPDDLVESLTVKTSAPETAAEPGSEPQPAAQPAAATTPQPTAATPAAVTPAAQPAATTTPATVPGTTPQDPAAIVAQPGAVVETPEAKAARETARAEAREKWMGELRQQFQLSEDDAKAMLLEPEKVLPNLAANLYARIFDSIMETLPHVVPQYVAQHNVMSRRESTARGMLFERWPDLNKPELIPVIAQVGQLFRSNNKDATPDVAVDRIGRLAYAALGWELPTGGAKPPAGAPKPTPKPFTPAQPGAGGGTPRPKPPANAFEDLVDGPPGSG